MNPKVHIIAGPNGAGKTTFATEFLPRFAHCPEFVNADLLAQGLSPFAPEGAAVQAGRLMIERIEDLAAKRIDFGFETTLSGRTFLNLIKRLKEQGYSIQIYFLWLTTVDLALARVAERVQRGGHNIPEIVVRRRFKAGLRNFIREYRTYAEEWILFDNSDIQLRKIAQLKEGELAIYDEGLYNKALLETSK